MGHGVVPYKHETGDRKASFAQGPHRVLLVLFTSYKYVSLLKLQNFPGPQFLIFKKRIL